MVVKKKQAPVNPSPFTRETDWEGFTAGALVDVLAPRWRGSDGRKLKGVVFKFMAHVTNISTGKTWIEVYGGRPNYETIYSFTEDQVALIPPKKTRKRRKK